MSDSLWSDYMRETYGRRTLYYYEDGWPAGFLTYEKQGDDLYIPDIYVAPEYRRKGVGSHLFAGALQTARDWGCRRILGTVDVSRPGWRESIAAQEAVGFKLSATNDKGQALLIYDLSGREP